MLIFNFCSFSWHFCSNANTIKIKKYKKEHSPSVNRFTKATCLWGRQCRRKDLEQVSILSQTSNFSSPFFLDKRRYTCYEYLFVLKQTKKRSENTNLLSHKRIFKNNSVKTKVNIGRPVIPIN